MGVGLHPLECYRGEDFAPPFVVGAPILTSSIGNPSIITTQYPHGLKNGQTQAIVGHVGSTPSINGIYVVSLISDASFSIPLSVTVAGKWGVVSFTTSIAGWLIQMTVKDADATLAPLVQTPGVIVDAANLLFTVPLSAAQTNLAVGSYPYDVWRIDPGFHWLLAEGMFTIKSARRLAA